MRQLDIYSPDEIRSEIRRLRKTADSAKPLKKFATKMTGTVVA
jgi:hypothetical protein